MRTLPLAASALVLASIASVAAAQDDRYGPPPEADASGASGHADARSQAYNGPFLSWANKAGPELDQAPPPAPPPPVMTYAPRERMDGPPSQVAQRQSGDSVQIRPDPTNASRSYASQTTSQSYGGRGYATDGYVTQRSATHTTSNASQAQTSQSRAFASQTTAASSSQAAASQSSVTDAAQRQASLTAPTRHARHAPIIVKASPPPPPALAQSQPTPTDSSSQAAANQGGSQQTASQQASAQQDAPPAALAQGDGYQGPPTGVHFYSLHREYGLTPDPDPTPTDRPLVLIGPPTDQSAAQHDDTAGGAGADNDTSDDNASSDGDHSGKSGHGAATDGAD